MRIMAVSSKEKMGSGRMGFCFFFIIKMLVVGRSRVDNELRN